MAADLKVLVDSIVANTAGLPDPQTLASWTPRLNGDIEIQILSDGSWQHDGEPIRREGLVRLFASLLRREEDGDYYLVTPVEKWRIRVERHPLSVIDIQEQRATEPSASGDVGSAVATTNWYALLNTGGRCLLGGANRLTPAGESGEPYLDLPNGLSAQLTRAAWYRLIESASTDGQRAFIISAGARVDLGAIADE
ncbi:MAG: hypothetical protein ACI87W_002716 [Halieaceae bacterium]